MRHLHCFVILLSLFTTSCQAQQASQTIGAKAFYDSLQLKKDITVLDVRTHDEFESGYISGAFNMNYNDPLFQSKINILEKEKHYYVYCLSGGRSTAAANYMRKNGFTNVFDMKGGILAWQGRSFPLVVSSGEIKADKISIEKYEQLTKADSVVLIDFFATWCAPCRQMEPMLAELAKEYKGKLIITRIDIDENKQLAKHLGVEEVPVFKMFHRGKEVWSKKGIVEKKELLDAVERFK